MDQGNDWVKVLKTAYYYGDWRESDIANASRHPEWIVKDEVVHITRSDSGSETYSIKLYQKSFKVGNETYVRGNDSSSLIPKDWFAPLRFRPEQTVYSLKTAYFDEHAREWVVCNDKSEARKYQEFLLEGQAVTFARYEEQGWCEKTGRIGILFNRTLGATGIPEEWLEHYPPLPRKSRIEIALQDYNEKVFKVQRA